MLLGAHMSVSGGLHKAFERGAAIGCQTMQVFTKSERQWHAKPLTEADLSLWHRVKQAFSITPVLTHDSYLINMANPSDEAWEKSIAAFEDEISRNSALGISYLVTHAGSHLGTGETVGLARIAQAVNRIHRKFADAGNAPGTTILFETTAGQGTAVGYKFEHWARLLEQLEHPEWVGICVDTCHIFAAGYNIATADGYKSTFDEFEHYIGTDKIKAFHMNDSKQGLGCRVDRHEAIGQGAIGLEAFRFLVNDLRFQNVPMVLETPKGDDDQADIANLAVLRGLLETETKA